MIAIIKLIFFLLKMDNKIVFVFIFLLLFIGNIKSTFYKFMILLPRSSCVSSSNLKIYYKKNSNEYITPLRLAIYIYIYIYMYF